MAKVVARGVTTFKYFMAYKGALMVDDERDVRLVPALRRTRRHAARPCRERRRRGGPAGEHAWPPASPAPKAHAYSRPPEVEGEAANRAIMLADQAGVPLYIVHTSSSRPTRRSRGPAASASGSMASR